MVTTTEQVFKYCQEKNLPIPSAKDLSHIGHSVRNRFNQQFMKSDLGIIAETGLVKVIENDKPMIVLGYPDVFLPNMLHCINWWYIKKQERIQKDATEKAVAATKKEKPMRARIPSKRPIYSGK